MKKIFWMLFAVLATAFTACDKSEELVFEHEYPMFELREGAILMEVLMPAGTKAEDELYIVGEFNGGEEAAVGQMQWQMIPSDNIHKWGIYLYPETFVEGKTLADGYYFYSKKDGKERTVLNEDILHYENANPGERINNLMVSRWESYFLGGDKPMPETEGPAIYVDNQAGYEALALYVWGGTFGNDGTGTWPGMQPTGTWTKNGVTYTYFDLGANALGLDGNFIVNNNGNNSQTSDIFLLMDRNHFIRIFTDGTWAEVDPETPGDVELPEPDGFSIYVNNQTGWDKVLLHIDSAEGETTPWPGIEPTDTFVNEDEVEFVRFVTDYALTDCDVNVTLINPDGGTYVGPIAFTLSGDTYLTATTSGVEAYRTIPDGAFKIYIKNSTESALKLYGSIEGKPEPMGAWPGMDPTDEEVIEGVTYSVFEIPQAANGQDLNLIANDNAGWQVDFETIVLDQNYAFEISKAEDGTGVVTPISLALSTYKIYVKKTTDESVTLYAYGDNLTEEDLFGEWPGIASNGEVEIEGKTYLYFNIPDEMNGYLFTPVFGFNQAAEDETLRWQAEYKAVKIIRDYSFEITKKIADDGTATIGIKEIDPYAKPQPVYKVYLKNSSSHEALTLYAWSDGISDSDIFGVWSGSQPSSEAVIDGQTYLVFNIPVAMNGKVLNLIVNNNGGGWQLEGQEGLASVTADHNMALEVTDTAVTLINADFLNYTYRVYLDNQAGWEALALYSWGADAAQDGFGSWPGATPVGTEKVGDVTYSFFGVPDAMNGLEANLIFNNNNNDSQTADQKVTIDRDYYFRVNSDNSCVLLEM